MSYERLAPATGARPRRCTRDGFAEELLTRGLLLVGARDAGWAEPAAFLLSAVLFALLHGINALFGQSVVKAAGQVVVAFVAGAAFYVTRMTTGSLVVATLLHALWDLGQLGTIATGRTLRPAVAPFTLLTFVAGLVATAVVLLG